MIWWLLVFCALCSFLLNTSTPLLQTSLLKGIFSGTLHRALSHLPLCPGGISCFNIYKLFPAGRLLFHNIHLLQIFFSFTDLPPHIISKKKRSCLDPILVAQKEHSALGSPPPPPFTWPTECYNLGVTFMQKKPTAIALGIINIINLYYKQVLCKHSMVHSQRISVLAWKTSLRPLDGLSLVTTTYLLD